MSNIVWLNNKEYFYRIFQGTIGKEMNYQKGIVINKFTARKCNDNNHYFLANHAVCDNIFFLKIPIKGVDDFLLFYYILD